MSWRFSGTIVSGSYAGRWRVAASLIELAQQVDKEWPLRRTNYDGTLGDTAHQARESDHNPNIADGSVSVVTAIDITEDLAVGLDMGEMFELLRMSRDPRIKYAIHQGRMFSSYPAHGFAAYRWRTYSGPDMHLGHGHLSVQPTKALYDDQSQWAILGGTMSAEHPPTSFNDFVAGHKISDKPSWFGVWPSYVERGLTTVEDSWAYPTNRLDLAWLYNKAIAPLESRCNQLEAQVRDLKVQVAQLAAGGGSGGGLTEAEVVTLGDARWVKRGKHEIIL